MKKVGKKLLSIICILTMLLTLPGVTVLAEEIQEGDVLVSDLEEELSPIDQSTVDEIDEDVISESVVGDDSDSTEVETERDDSAVEELPESISESDKSVNEEIVELEDESLQDESEEQVMEELVGAKTVGTDVTATFDSSTGAVTFYSNDGTLYRDWIIQAGYTRSNIKSISVASGTVYLPSDSNNLFYGCTGLISIDFSGFDTSNVTNMPSMFYNCTSLTSLDMSGFDTSNVTDMSYMFYNCTSLTSLDMSSFDTSNVTNMGSMFYYCSSLANLDLSSFNTSNVTNMGSMFFHCNSLANLDLSSFNTSNVTNMDSMFYYCSSLTNLDMSSFDTSKVNNTSSMFSMCTKIQILKTPRINNAYGKLPYLMFDESGQSYTSLPFSSESISLKNAIYNIIVGENVSANFFSDTGTVELKTVEGELWDDWVSKLGVDKYYIKAITVVSGIIYLPSDSSNFFSGFDGLTSLDLSGFDTSSVTNMIAMFNGCSSLTSLDLSSFDTLNVENMGDMFCECSSLTSLDLSRFNTTNVTDMSSMFSGCSSLTSLDLSSFDTKNVENMGDMFYWCRSLTSLNLSSFDTKNVENMGGMFCECSNLTSLDLSRFNTTNVTDMSSMFSGCSSLTNLNLSNFDTSHVTDMDVMFNNCSSLTSLDLSNFDTSNVNYYSSVFDGCLELKTLKTPKMNNLVIEIPKEMYDEFGNVYLNLPSFSKSFIIKDTIFTTVVGNGVSATFDADTGTAELRTLNGELWHDWVNKLGVNRDDIKAINVESGIVYLPPDSSGYNDGYQMFGGLKNLIGLDFSGFNTSNVTSMRNLFLNCSSLTSLDLNNIDTTSVTDMGYMFSGCSSLTNLDLNNIDTTSVTDMGYMFSGCSSLTSLDLENFDTTNVTDMGHMFSGCSSLTYLDLNNIDTKNVTDMGYMFSSCSKLSGIYLSSFKTINVLNISGMFCNCSSLGGLDLSSFNTSNVRECSDVFTGCSVLQILKTPGVNVPEINLPTTMYEQTANAYVKLPPFTHSITLIRMENGIIVGDNVIAVFDSETGTVELTSAEGELWSDWVERLGIRRNEITSIKVVFGTVYLPSNSSGYSNGYRLFGGLNNITNLELNHFEISKVTDMSKMFYGCSNLTQLDLSNLNSANVKNMASMFEGCSCLNELNLSGFNTSAATTMASMFNNCSSLTCLDLSDFNTQNVTNMSNMFNGCSKLTSLDLSHFNTSNVIDMQYMFKACSKLSNLDLSSFNTSKVKFYKSVIEGCSDLLCFKTPKINTLEITLPFTMYDEYGNTYINLPSLYKSITLTRRNPIEPDISYCTVEISQSNYIYDGVSKEPTVIVKDGDKTLSLGIDYIVSYSDNKDAGVATIKITGKGIYIGEESFTFTISKAEPMMTFANERIAGTTLDDSFVNELEAITDGNITYTSDNTDVAIVDNNSGQVTITGIGTAIITATATEGNNYKSGSVAYTVTIIDGRTDLSECTIKLSATSYTYDGSVKKPSATVIVGNNVLTVGTDYTISYKDNTNAGTATVNVKGRGIYKGEKTVTFIINKAEAKLKFTNERIQRTTLDNPFVNKLEAKTDGIITFDSDNTEVASIENNSGQVIITGIGTTTITATAAEGNNYQSGSASYTLTVVDGRQDISDCKVTLSETSYIYDGSAIEPSVTVMYGNSVLSADEDYTYSYENNTNVGKGTIKIAGKGKYQGEKFYQFEIKPREINDGNATTKYNIYSYTCTPRLPAMILTVNSITLVQDVDYTLAYENNIEIGTATVIAHGIGNYTGEKSCTFEIVYDGPVSIATATIATKSESYVYTGTKRNPRPIITLGEKTLVYGTDYSLTYENDLNVGTATVIAHGKGAYTGTVSCTYGITPRDISEGTASTKSKSYAFNGKPRHPAMILVVNNRTLVKDVDYTLTYENDTEVGTATVTAHGIGNYVGEKSCTYGIVIVKPTTIQYAKITTKSPSYVYTGTPRDPSPIITLGGKTLVKGTDYDLSYKNDVNVGTATVTATGKGDYKGTVSCTYGITPRDISDGTASTKSWAYLYKGTPRHPNMILVVNNKTLVKDKDFNLSYENDIEPGTATVTANGIGNYQGQKSCTFEILAEAIDISECSIAGNSLSYGYSGKAYTPNITVKLGEKTLTKDTDYTVTYKNNVNPGTASITVTGKGIYAGTRTKTFEIVDCVSSLVSGKTYQLIPKNNSKTAVSSFGGKMVKNTKVYITDRSNSEAMKFKAIQNADGTWKFINAKCEMALAVKSNSSAVGNYLVLYDQTTKPAQNWKLTRKSDNSFGIINAVSGLYVAMSDESAVKGTTLSMEENSGRGLQRFYIAETTAVSAPFDGTRAVKASKNKNYAMSIASASKEDGANVNLAAYSNSNDKKFNIIYSGGGYYRLVNVNSKLVLSVAGNTKTNGANVIQSEWAGESGQRWKFTKNADGTVTLTNALGTVLHLNGNKTANGTNIIAKTASTTGAQKWYLE